MANMLYDIEDAYFDKWKKSGIYEQMQSAWNSASNSGKLNDVQAPQLLKQYVEKGGDAADIEDGSNDAKVSSTMIMKKLANYLANKQVQANKTGDNSILQEAQAKVGSAIKTLTSYSKGNHQQFMETLGAVSGFDKDLNYTTFGEQTDYDKGLQEDTSAIERITQTAGDMSLLAGAKRGAWNNRRDQIERSINNELVRRGAVNESFMEKASGIVGGLALATIESIGLSKLGGAAGLKALSKTKMNDISKIKTGQDIARYIGQGMVLPIVQNLQDQAGLTEKYDDGSGYMKLAGDAIQNTASMFVGDQIMSPVLNAYKSKAMVEISKNYSKESINKAIATAKAESKDAIDAVSSLLKVKDKSFVNKYVNEALLGNVSKSTEAALDANLGKLMKQSANAALLREWWKPATLFGAELGADLAFDLATTTGLDMMGENLATVHQTGMYSLPEIFQSGDWKGAIQSLISQRLGMKAGGMLINKIQSKMVNTKREELGTTASIKKELGLDKLTPTQAIMVRLNNTLFGNDMAELDTYTRDAVGESLNDMFQNDGSRFKGALAAWMYSKSANNIISVGWAESIVGNMFKETSGMNPKELSQFFNHSIPMASNFRQQLEEIMVPMKGTEASVLDIDVSHIDRLSSLVSDRVLETLTKFSYNEEQKKYSLDQDELKKAVLRLGSFIGTFNAGNRELSDELFTAINRKVTSGLEAKVGNTVAANNAGKAVNVSLKDIVGADGLDSKAWSSLNINEKDALEEHNLTKDMLLREGFKSTKRFDKENAHNLYSFLATLKAGMQGEDYKKFIKDVEKNQSVLPKSVVIDWQNIKDMDEMLKGFNENIKDEADMIREAENANGVFKEVANRMLKKYSDGIFTLVKNASNPDEPTLAESNQVVSYAIRLLNLAQRVSLNAEGKNSLTRMKGDQWIQKALKLAVSKNSRLSEITGYPGIKEMFGGDDSFNNIISKLVTMSSNIEIGNRLFAGHYLNSPKIKDILTSWGLGIYGENDIMKNRIVNWMVDFAQSPTTENGLLENISLDGREFGKDWVTRFNSTYQTLYNNEPLGQKDIDDIPHAYAIARAKAYARERFTSFKANYDFIDHMNKGDVEFKYSNTGVSFNVKSNNISIEDMQKYIVDNSFGVIKTDIAKSDGKTMNTTFTFGRYDGLSSKQLFEELNRIQVADIDIDGVMNSIVKMYAYSPDAAKSTMKTFIKKLDNGLAKLNQDEEISLNAFIEQQYVKNSAMNSFNLTWEIANPKDAYMKNAVMTFDQQRSWFDAIDGVSSVNISYDDEFVQRVGSSWDTPEWWRHVDQMAKRGLFAVVRKGNNMDWSFIKITDIDKEGNINLGKLTDILVTRLTSNRNTFANSTDPNQIKYVERLDKMIKDLNDQRNSAITTKDFARNFLNKYSDMLEEQYKDFNTKLPKGESLKEEPVFKDTEVEILMTKLKDDIIAKGDKTVEAYKSMLEQYNEMFRKGGVTQSLNEYLNMKLNNERGKMDKETRELAYTITSTYDKNKAMLSPYKDDLGKLLLKGFDTSTKKTKEFKALVNEGKIISTTRKAERELLNFALFGDNYIAEAGHIIKRFSYSNQSNYLKADGSWETGNFNVTDNGVTKTYTYQDWFKELASKYNVVFASLGGDGGCYFPRKVLDQMATQPDAVQGKLVTDWYFGGMKLNAEYSERLADVIQESGKRYTFQTQMPNGGLSASQVDIKNSIIIDVTAFKTMLPLSKDALSALKKGDTFVKANLDNETMAKFIASMTLHSPIETAAKKKGEFGLAVMTPMHTIGKTIGRSHIIRLSRILKDDKQITWDELLDPARMFGSWRKRMSQLNMDVSASAKVATWMPLTKMDSETMDKEDRDALNVLTKGKSYLPESHISAGLIASFFTASKSLVKNEYRGKAKSYRKFWDALSKDPDNLHKLIDEFRDGWLPDEELNYKRATTKSMQGEWKDNIGFVVDPKVADDFLRWDVEQKYFVKNSQGIVINKKYSYDESGKVLSKSEAYKKLYDNMGKETLHILSAGKNAPLQVYNVGDREVYMANITRFPNERAGQNYNVVISGITPRIYGMEINDYYYRMIHGGDYDGDAIQIIGLSSDDYKQGVLDVEGKNNITDEETVLNIINNHAKSVLAKENTLVPDISPSEFEGNFTQAGAPIATLYKMQFYDSVMKLSAHSNNVEDAVVNEWNERFYEAYTKTVEGSAEKLKITHLPKFVDDTDDMTKVAFVYSDENSLWDNIKFSHTGSNVVVSRDDIESGGLKFKVMITDVINSNNQPTQQMYLVQIDKSNDFPSMKVVSTRELTPKEMLIANLGPEQRMQLPNSILNTEKLLLDEYFKDLNNREVNWNDFNEKAQTDVPVRNEKGEVGIAKISRYMLPNNMSFVSKQMLTQVMNGVSVNNMKNNTLIFLLNKIATAGNQNALDDLIAKTTVALNFKSFIGPRPGSNKLVSGLGYPGIDLSKIDMTGFFDSVVSKVRQLADDGILFNRMSLNDFDNVKVLFNKIPDANESINAFNSLWKLMHFADKSDRIIQAKLPMQAQAAIIKFGQFLKNSTDQTTSETMGKSVSLLDDELKGLILGDSNLNNVFASKTIRRLDLGDQIEEKDPKNYEITNPIQYVYQFYSTKELMKKMDVGLWGNGNIANLFKINSNQIPILKSQDSDAMAFMGRLASEANKQGRKYTSDSIDKMLYNMRLSVKQSTRRMIGEEKLMEIISRDSKELTNDQIVKEIREANDTGAGANPVQGFEITTVDGKSLSLEKLAENLSSALSPKHEDDRELRNAIVKSIVGMLDEDQQRMFGYYSNGMTSKIVGLIEKDKLDKKDLLSIIDAQMHSKNLKKNNVTEFSNVVRDELSSRKIRGCE